MYYPICVDLTGKKCLVVGGGLVAQRKIESLLKTGGEVCVVSPEVTPDIEEWAEQGKITLQKRVFQPSDLGSVFVVIAATDEAKVHDQIYKLCEAKNILVNVVDVPAKCNFIVPSVIRRGQFMLAISTNGASPAFSKRIRKQLESEFGEEYAIFLNWMEEVRPQLKKLPSEQARKEAFEKLVYSSVLDLLKEGKAKEARQAFNLIVDQYS